MEAGSPRPSGYSRGARTASLVQFKVYTRQLIKAIWPSLTADVSLRVYKQAFSRVIQFSPVSFLACEKPDVTKIT